MWLTDRITKKLYIPEAIPVCNLDGSPISGGGSGGGSDRELVVTTYTATAAFTGAVKGDVITLTQVIDVSAAVPTTVATVWRNQSAAADLASAPSAASLEIVGAEALTDAQLRAAKIEVQDKSGWASEAISGKVRDAARDQIITYGDGTSETLHFTTGGEYAGKTARA